MLPSTSRWLFLELTTLALLAQLRTTSATTTTSIPTPSPSPFTYEATFLTPDFITGVPELQFDPDTPFEFPDDEPSATRRSAKRNSQGPKRKCKVIPGDISWPREESWRILGTVAEGELTRTVPLAGVCYNLTSDYTQTCEEVTERWGDSDLHDADPASIMSPFMQGATCLPPSLAGPNATCTLGGYPTYVLTVKNVRDVQLAVNFARNMGLRLVVKNTGHDFSGKSSGAHSISVRTHLFKDIEYIPAYNGPGGYKGKAFKVGAGVQGFEIYKAAYERGLVVVGGEGMTVGFAGGYIQAGGHSPLSSLYGMAADHVLSFNIITSTGHFLTANPITHPDLFWALRGGGGSTFGIVTSVIVKAFPDLPVTTASFSLQAGEPVGQGNPNITTDILWDAIKSYFLTFPTMVDAGVYSYFQLQSNRFTFYPGLFGPNLTSEKVKSLLSPIFQTLQQKLNIDPVKVQELLSLNITTHPSFYPAWKNSFPKEPIGGGNTQPGSRLFPRENFVNKRKFEDTFRVVKEVVFDTGFFLGFNISPRRVKSGLGDDDNAVSEHWRSTVLHAISGVFWAPGATEDEIEKARDQLTWGHMKKWRDVSPGSGVYMNECDVREPNFQQAMYGKKYNQLYKIKQKYDPKGVFYAVTAVGSEDWKADEKGRLCPI